MAHGSPRDPIWEYLFSTPVARRNLSAFDTRHCLVGHTHVPLVFRDDDGLMETLSPSDGSRLNLDERRTILNPAASATRDGDPRACAMILDPEAGHAEWHRIAYDVPKVQGSMRAAGLPERLGTATRIRSVTASSEATDPSWARPPDRPMVRLPACPTTRFRPPISAPCWASTAGPTDALVVRVGCELANGRDGADRAARGGGRLAPRPGRGDRGRQRTAPPRCSTWPRRWRRSTGSRCGRNSSRRATSARHSWTRPPSWAPTSCCSGLPYRKRFGGDFAIGSTIPYVFQNAPCAVIVVREPVAASEQRRTAGQAGPAHRRLRPDWEATRCRCARSSWAVGGSAPSSRIAWRSPGTTSPCSTS